jgi:hypothetical protein
MGKILPYLLIVFLFLSCSDFRYYDGNQGVRVQKLNTGWEFYKGTLENAYSNSIDDSNWTKVNLPHDWSVGQVGDSSQQLFDRKCPGGGATGFIPGGEGWYRKQFMGHDTSLLHFIEFEGIYMESEIWLNGQKLTYHPNGYTSFICDISKYCLPGGKENLLEVHMVNQGKNSRWYAGSGIYRNVWLITTHKLHFNEWGQWVETQSVDSLKAEIVVHTSAQNQSDKEKQVSLLVDIYTPDGIRIASETRSVVFIPGMELRNNLHLTINKPLLWSVEKPNRYKVRLTVKDERQTYDETEISCGIRTIGFSAGKGFQLNGIPIKLKGGCLHHDNGFLGAAAIDRAEVRKVELLKANGFNAVRCAHNPPSVTFLNACDQLGLLVIDEAFDQWQKPKNPDDYHRFFDQYARQDIQSMVCRDRNHPSVIIWSIGNEIQERADSSGIAIARQLRNYIYQYDSTRPITAAINDFWDNPGKKWDATKSTFDQLDIAGYNYMWYEYENDHQKCPERVMMGTESTPMEASVNWHLVEKNPWLIGDFVWTAMDYLGESGIGKALQVDPKLKDQPFDQWPWYNAWCGDIDFCGTKKIQSQYRDVVWGSKKLVMAVHVPIAKNLTEQVSYWGWPDEMQSWNWEGHEGKPMQVHVYGQPGTVTLYLNNQLIGKKTLTLENKLTATFYVGYQPGVLKAIRQEDETIAILETTGKTQKLVIIPDRTVISASPDDLVYLKIRALDEHNKLVINEDRAIEIKMTGEGEIAGSGNASPNDMQSFRSTHPKLFHGVAMVILRPNGKKGEMKLTVTSERLPAVSETITTN